MLVGEDAGQTVGFEFVVAGLVDQIESCLGAQDALYRSLAESSYEVIPKKYMI